MTRTSRVAGDVRVNTQQDMKDRLFLVPVAAIDVRVAKVGLGGLFAPKGLQDSARVGISTNGGAVELHAVKAFGCYYPPRGTKKNSSLCRLI
jgi:hypothetical protein